VEFRTHDLVVHRPGKFRRSRRNGIWAKGGRHGFVTDVTGKSVWWNLGLYNTHAVGIGDFEVCARNKFPSTDVFSHGECRHAYDEDRCVVVRLLDHSRDVGRIRHLRLLSPEQRERLQQPPMQCDTGIMFQIPPSHTAHSYLDDRGIARRSRRTRSTSMIKMFEKSKWYSLLVGTLRYFLLVYQKLHFLKFMLKV